MTKQATNTILTFVSILIIFSTTGFAKEEPESYPLEDNSYYTTQDDLTYIHSFYDEGLLNSRKLYELDRMIQNLEQNPRKLNYSDFDAIDYEMYSKGQKMLNKF